MKSQYPMTTHNHITSVLNIFKGRTGKWLMLFLLLLPALATAQETKKLIILQTSDVHSRIEPMTQKATGTTVRVDLSVGQVSCSSSAKKIRMYCCSIAAISRKALLIIICLKVR